MLPRALLAAAAVLVLAGAAAAAPAKRRDVAPPPDNCSKGVREKINWGVATAAYQAST